VRALRWCAAAVLLGAVCGLVAVAFEALSFGAEGAFRAAPALLALLPFSGAATVWVYHRLKIPFNTDAPNVIADLRRDRTVPGRLACALLVCVPLANLGGGSVGHTAAGLQMGGALADPFVRFVGGREGDARVLMMAGMAAMVASLLYTPLAAVVFVVEICRQSRAQVLDVRMLAVPLAAGVAYAIASVLGIGRIQLGPVAVPEAGTAWIAACAVGAACAALGLLFVFALKALRTFCIKAFDNLYTRMLVGAGAAAVLTLLAGTDAASGTGGATVAALFAGAPVDWWVWVLKFALTAICLAFGFKGGAIMPVICMGACAGCALGQAAGWPVPFAAAVGMTACIAAAARSPFGGFLMAVEVCGLAGAPFFALAALFGAVAARRDSLYGGIDWTIDPRRWVLVGKRIMSRSRLHR